MQHFPFMILSPKIMVLTGSELWTWTDLPKTKRGRSLVGSRGDSEQAVRRQMESSFHYPSSAVSVLFAEAQLIF